MFNPQFSQWPRGGASRFASVRLFLIRHVFFTSPPPTGRTTLGHGPADIHIQGPGVAPNHCYIDNKCGVITLHPCGNPCAVDGLQVTQPVRLSQGRSHLSQGLFTQASTRERALCKAGVGGGTRVESEKGGVVYFTAGSVRDVRLLNGGVAPPSCN